MSLSESNWAFLSIIGLLCLWDGIKKNPPFFLWGLLFTFWSQFFSLQRKFLNSFIRIMFEQRLFSKMDRGKASQVALAVRNLSANAGDIRDAGSIPGTGRSPKGGHDTLLQYSCLENPMDKGAWWATVHRVAKSWTWLSDWTEWNKNMFKKLMKGNSPNGH